MSPGWTLDKSLEYFISRYLNHVLNLVIDVHLLLLGQFLPDGLHFLVESVDIHIGITGFHHFLPLGEKQVGEGVGVKGVEPLVEFFDAHI